MRTPEETWELLAQTDPLWAICSDPEKRGGRWTAEEFFATGETEVSIVLRYVVESGAKLDYAGPALDFGCGAGRLTQALATRFDSVYGIDISPTMIELAVSYNRHSDHCSYAVNTSEALPDLVDNTFTFIYSSIVLQHIRPNVCMNYLAGLSRVLRPGGYIVFQLPEHVVSSLDRLRSVMQIRTRLRKAEEFLRGKRVPEPLMYEWHGIAEDTVRKWLRQHGVEVQKIEVTNSIEPNFNGNIHYLTNGHDKVQTGQIVSKQYLCRKI